MSATIAESSHALTVQWTRMATAELSPIRTLWLRTLLIATVRPARSPAPNQTVHTVPKHKQTWLSIWKCTQIRFSTTARYFFFCFFFILSSYSNITFLQEAGCDFSCRTNFTLQKHLRKVHEGNTEPLYECHACLHRVTSTRALKSHLRLVHKILPTSGNGRFK